MKYRVLIEPDEDGVFVAQCPSLPGCVSEGKTREEAVKNIQEAIEGYIESLKAHGSDSTLDRRRDRRSQRMTRLPVVSDRQAVKAFRKFGYELDRQHGSHLILR